MNFLLSLLALGAFSLPASATVEFGKEGRDGRNGASGSAGASGRDQTITATGETFQLDMSGRDGSDAQDGESGLAAHDCDQKLTNDFMQGARGGDGGEAGRAGDGGSGGDLTIYTSNYENLKKVYVDASGGKAGRGGRAGRGASGCACTRTSWEWTDHSTGNKWTYSCTNGRDGVDRSDSGSGTAGNSGQLILIKRTKPLGAVTNTLDINLGSITNQAYTLSNHVFVSKDGASGLLSPGSKIADRYSEYSHTQSWSYGFDWKSERPLSHFSDSRIHLSASNDGQGINVELPSDLWITQHIDNSGSYPVMVIEEAVRLSEVKAVASRIYGSASGLTIEMVDQGNVGKWVETKANLTITGKKFWSTKVIFKGPVTLTKGSNENTFLIKVGALPGIDLSALAVGKKLVVTLEIERRMSNNRTVITKKTDYQVTAVAKN